MANRYKGVSNRRKWTRAEFFAHSKNKQADKCLDDTLQEISHESFNKRMDFEQQMRELRDSFRPLRCTTGRSDWYPVVAIPNRKSVTFAADVRFCSLDSLPSRHLSAKSKKSTPSFGNLRVRPSTTLTHVSTVDHNVESPVSKTRPLVSLEHKTPLKSSITDPQTVEDTPDECLSQDLEETLRKNAEENKTKANIEIKNNNEENDIGELSIKTEEEIIFDKAKQEFRKLPTVFDIQKLRDEKEKAAGEKKLRRQVSGLSKEESESMGSSWSYDLSFGSSTDSDSRDGSDYLDSKMHTVPILRKKKKKKLHVDVDVCKETQSTNGNEESKNDNSIKQTPDYVSQESTEEPNEILDDQINDQIMQVMSDEVNEELEKLVQEESERDEENRPNSEGERYSPYAVNYSCLSMSASTKNQSGRIIGRGPLEKPKCILEKEVAMRIFNRTLNAALANNRFRDGPQKAKDDAELAAKNSEKSEAQQRRTKSASVPIARYIRAVEAGLETEHIVTSVRNLNVPISKARIKRERQNMVQKLIPHRTDSEEERIRMKEIEEKMRTFLKLLPQDTVYERD